MNRRLPQQPGEWIDRSRPIRFTFEGEPCEGYAGDVMTSALYAKGVTTVGRSFKYHRPRGSYSLANLDAHAVFTDGVRTNIRGDATFIEPGLNLSAVNTFGGLKHDRMRFTEPFSKFMPVGFYYKAFHTPRWLFPFHETQIRKVAGLGAINPSFPATHSPKDYAWCDVLVVGGGPSGLSAALAAADAGAKVMLVDEQPRPGGSLNYAHGGDAATRKTLATLIDRVEGHACIEVRCGSMLGGSFTDQWYALFDAVRLTKLRAGTVVFATGVMEQPAVFQNNDLPGVMLASAAQRLIRLYAIKPCDSAVILAANDAAYQAAMDLHEVGVSVKAVVDLRKTVPPSSSVTRLREAGITIHEHSCIFEAAHTQNKMKITGAIVCPLGPDGEPDVSRKQTIACESIVVGVGYMPNAGQLYQAGVRFGYNEVLHQLAPATIPAGVFVAGRVRGVFDLQDRMKDGQHAGMAAASHIGTFAGAPPARPSIATTPQSHPFPIFRHPGKKNFVDFDEDLHLVDFANAHQEGYDNIELLKRYSTVGMGPSQGKLANMNAVRILARLNGATIDQTGTTTSRPFHQPVPIGHLAGRRFHPMRHTPMHDWHIANHAELMHAGAWYRPEYYRRPGTSRDDCIVAEARQVRQSLGIIDLSTLGKIMITGPDAATFIERIYTGRFANMKTGMQRYAVAVDETGVVFEDGVVARLSDDSFYITTTSSGAAHFYQDIQRWRIIWQLDVTIINLTSTFAAMNIAGPQSRDALSTLTDIDLSAEAFPYLGVRQGNVAGAKAMLLRTGFVGELGYEIHIPFSFAMHAWNALLEAGKAQDIQPFGVEAQRLLRLEKGHLIISHDTDALTNPYEAGLGWTVKDDKDFFVGRRTLQIIKRREQKRILVGIRWPDGYTGPLPQECHLIIHDGRIVGRVTSIAERSLCGYPLGMAFIEPAMAEPGTTLTIRVDGGVTTTATVTALPHYDPKNERQS